MATVYFYPNNGISSRFILYYGASSIITAIDDPVGSEDGWGSYVRENYGVGGGNLVVSFESFISKNILVESINSVKIGAYCLCSKTNSTVDVYQVQSGYADRLWFTGTNKTCASFTTLGSIKSTNPNTGLSWTLNEVNNFTVKAALDNDGMSNTSADAILSALYLVVNYNPASNLPKTGGSSLLMI